MIQFFIPFWNIQPRVLLSLTTLLTSDLLSFLKGCVHIKNKSVSEIFYSFTMGTYPSPKLRQAENIHFFHFSKMEINFCHEPSFRPCVRDLICMFEIFCFSAPGDYVSTLGAHLV